MSHDEFTKLFSYMSTEFAQVHASLEQKASSKDMKNILKYLDTVTKRQEISDDERLVMGHQLERLNKWTHELANEIGYKLTV